MGLKFFAVIALTLSLPAASITATGIFAAARSTSGSVSVRNTRGTDLRWPAVRHRSGSHNAVFAGDIGPTSPLPGLM